MDLLLFIVQQVNSIINNPLKIFSFGIFILGVGRTGVFITMSIVFERIRYEGVVDVFQTVKLLRTQRPALVQTEVKDFLSIKTHCHVFVSLFRININSVIDLLWNISVHSTISFPINSSQYSDL